jgi:hypothetical protein
MIQIMAALNTYLIAKVPTVGTNINEDFFSGDAASEVICRHDTCPRTVKAYFDGSEWRRFDFSYHVRRDNPITARQITELIIEALYMPQFENLFGLTEGRIEIASQPHPISLGDGGIVTYTSSFQLEYLQEA